MHGVTIKIVSEFPFKKMAIFVVLYTSVILLLSLQMGIPKILMITTGTISCNFSDVITVFLNAIFMITVPFKVLSHF